MKFNVTRKGFEIYPENETDKAFVEDTLGLKLRYASIPLVRENMFGSPDLYRLSTTPFPAPAQETYEPPTLRELDLHPSTRDILRHFRYDHLISSLQQISKPLCETALLMAATLEGPELTAGLRKLLEAKDCFVRAALPKEDE